MTSIDGKVWCVVLALLELGLLCWFGKVDGASMATAAQVLVGALIGARLVEDAPKAIAAFRSPKVGKTEEV